MRKAGSTVRFGGVAKEWGLFGRIGPCKLSTTGLGKRLEKLWWRTGRSVSTLVSRQGLSLNLETIYKQETSKVKKKCTHKSL